MPRINIQANQAQLKKITGKLKKLEEFPDETNKIMRRTAQDTIQEMRDNVIEMDAVETGRLLRNIKGQFSYNNIVIESEAIDPVTKINYAPIVHYGLARTGRNSTARPYFSRGVTWMIIELNKRLTRALKQLIR